MVNKRLKKLEMIQLDAIPPELVGNENYQMLIVGWGSTYHSIREALENLGREDVSFLHFKQVYPLHPNISDYLKKAKKVIIIENNATSQLGNLIRLYLNFDIRNKILQYNGLPFSVEEIQQNLRKYI